MGSWCSIKRLTPAFLALVTGLAMLLCAGSATASVQPGQKNQLALGVSPAITELVLKPGQPKRFVITVTNVTDVALPIKTTTASFNPQEEVADKDRALFDASKWIQTAEPEFILHPRQQKTVGLTITPPADAEPGGHYATIFFQPLVPAEVVKNNAALIGSKVGVLTLLTVKGDIREEAQASLDAPLFSQHGPIELHLHVKNTGNVHFIPTGSITIRNIWGNPVATMPLPPTLVLPKTTKTVSVKWNNKRQNGYFTARAAIRYDARQTALTSNLTRFLIFPWLGFSAFLLLTGIVGFAFWHIRDRWRDALSALFGETRQSKSGPKR